jgi:F-type H+-transporting ATPase subunit a
MQIFKILLMVAAFSLLPLSGFSAEAAAAEAPEAAAGHGKAEEHHQLPLHAVDLFKIGEFRITNSMVACWIVAIVLIIFAQIATRNIQQVPSGAQNFWEWLVESLYNFLDGIVGPVLVKKTYWFFATIFILILFSNWFGLIPGVGTIGWGAKTAEGFRVTQPLLRGVNADLNMTFAMAMTFFACWIVWALQVNGPGGFLFHIFGAKGDTKGALKLLMIVVFLLVGLLEVVSILFRPVSLSFRLFGNVYAGENMLEAMARIVPGWFGSVVIPIPFYFMEMLVGLVQALVFMLLTAVFTLLICQHDPSHDAKHAHH